MGVVLANEKMKELMLNNKKKKEKESNNNISIEKSFKKGVKNLGRKAVPVIRKIGEGVDKEQLEKASQKVSKVANDTKDTVTTQASKFWRNLMVLDEDEDLMTPFR